MTRPPELRRAKAIDVCAGAGGLSLGLQRAGWDVLGVEHDADACATHRAQVGPCEHADIREWHPPGPVEFVAGGVPCQPFSQAGQRLGTADPRGQLYLHLLRIAKEAEAKAIMLEMRGLIYRGLAEVRAEFERQGWITTWALLDAANFGVPQHRRRLFLVGFRAPLPFQFPVPTHGPWGLLGLDPWVTVREALGLSGSYTAGRLPGKGWQGMRCLDVEAPSYTVGGTVQELLAPLDRPAPCVSAGGTERGGGAEPFVNQRQREALQGALAALDRPAPCITAGEGRACGNLGARGGSARPRKAGDTIGPALAALDRPAPCILASEGNPPSVALGRVQEALALALLDRPAPAVTAREGKDGARGSRGGRARGRGAGEVVRQLASAGLLDRPSTTVDTTNGVSPAGNHERIRQAVRLSLPQLAALQAFPPGFVFQGNLTSQYRQVGNAVPPPLGEAMGGAVLAALRGGAHE